MRYLAVMLASLGVGAVVYAISMRSGMDEVHAIGFEPERTERDEGADLAVDGPPPGYTYLQVPVTRGPSIGERFQGLVGSLALVAIAMVGVAATLYAVGWAVSRVIRSFLGNDDGSLPPP